VNEYFITELQSRRSDVWYTGPLVRRSTMPKTRYSEDPLFGL